MTRWLRSAGRPTGTGWPAALATDGGVRTQVWVVRPDGRDARLVAGGPDQHAELGPWTRSGHRVVVTIPGAALDHDGVAYLADPGTGDLTPLATGDLIRVLDLSVDESYVIVQDGPRGRQFCVLVDRVADQDLPLLPYPDLGSTERAMIRPAPDGDGLVAYLATDAALPRRQLVALPLGPGGLARRTPASSARGTMPSSRGWTATTRAACCCWSGTWPAGGSELELLDTRTGPSRKAPEPARRGHRGAAQPRRQHRGDERRGPAAAARALAPGHRDAGLDPGHRRAEPARARSGPADAASSSSAGTGCR